MLLPHNVGQKSSYTCYLQHGPYPSSIFKQIVGPSNTESPSHLLAPKAWLTRRLTSSTSATTFWPTTINLRSGSCARIQRSSFVIHASRSGFRCAAFWGVCGFSESDRSLSSRLRKMISARAMIVPLTWHYLKSFSWWWTVWGCERSIGCTCCGKGSCGLKELMLLHWRDWQLK